jgi:hypothetical protein
MEDLEFVRKYSRIIADSPLSALPVLVEGFTRAFNLQTSPEDLASELVGAIRRAEDPRAALEIINETLSFYQSISMKKP